MSLILWWRLSNHFLPVVIASRRRRFGRTWVSSLVVTKGKSNDYFKDSISIDTDLLKMAKLAVFSGGKPKAEAVAWEAYGRYDDAVTYSKTDQEWEFGKIMTFRTLTFKGGGCMTQWHLWSVLTLQFNFSCIFAFMSTY